MFRILCDPSSGIAELCLTDRYFVVCLFGVWQRNFNPMVCVYGPAGRPDRTHTPHDKISVNHYE